MMKTKDIKKGISLIVLIVTIIVVIILAAVVILTLSKNNPIESAKEARFKEDVRTFQDELALTVSKQYTTAGGHRDEKITTSDFDEIKEYIPSFSEKYKDKFIIQDDELRYTQQLDDVEKEYAKGLNVKEKRKLLPDEYQQVEYIESTGTQWINTKCKSNSDLVIHTKAILNETNTGYLFGEGIQGKYVNIGILKLVQDNFYSARIATEHLQSSNVTINSEISIGDIPHEFILGSKVGFYIDNNKISDGVEYEYSDGDNIYVFSWNGRNGNVNSTTCKIYTFMIKEGVDFVRNYIPCYTTTTVTNVDGEICDEGTAGLYDLVEGKFYTNRGDKTKGDFKCGPEVQ